MGRGHTAATVLARLALAAGFLSAVADRFGYRGTPGTPGVAWGDFAVFLAYTGKITYAPDLLVAVLGWTATVLEVLFAFLLFVGFQTRLAALGSGVLLALFAVAMAAATGPKSALDASVPAAAAAAFLLATFRDFPYSLDTLIENRR